MIVQRPGGRRAARRAVPLDTHMLLDDAAVVSAAGRRPAAPPLRGMSPVSVAATIHPLRTSQPAHHFLVGCRGLPPRQYLLLARFLSAGAIAYYEF